MEDDELLFLPGDCFRCQTSNGVRVAQIIRKLDDGSFSVHFWTTAGEQSNINYFLPSILTSTNEEGIMETPRTLSSLVFLHQVDAVKSYSIRYTFGQKNMYCFQELPNHLSLPSFQSISYIVGEGLRHISIELQKVLSNKRQNQTSYSISNVPITALTWRYLTDVLGVPVVDTTTTTTSHISRGRDMSLTHVKKRIACKVMRIETFNALSTLISVIGITAAVGVRKKLPGMTERMRPDDNIICERIGIQRLDNINLVDVSSNDSRPRRLPNTRFRQNADGYQGVDFFFFPELSTLRISVRYTCFLANDAEAKLMQLGIIESNNRRRRMTDEELDLLN